MTRKHLRPSLAASGRRSFLRGAAGAAFALPLLQMHQRTAHAEAGIAEDGFPLRFVVFFHPNGVWPPTWWPQGNPTENQFELASSLQPLQPFKDQLLILDGVDMPAADAGPGEDHQQGMGAVLSGMALQAGGFVGGDGSLAGWGNGISVDQVIAQHIGGTTPFGSLEFGVRASAFGGSEVRTRMVYAGPAQPISPIDDPVAMWNLLFSELNLSPSEMAVLRAKRVSVLDTVQGQFAALEARAGAEDRLRLQQHAALVTELETRLSTEPVLGESCVIPAAPPALNPDSAGTMDQISTLQLDMMVMAFACDLTRVASIQYSNGMNHTQFPWIGSSTDGHALSHAGMTDEASWAEWSMRERWYGTQFAHLMQRMSEIPEGDGTMLDHTVILWVNELSQGNTHSHERMPFVLGGNLAGHFRTGRYLAYDHQPHNNLLLSLVHAFGIDQATFGDPAFCTGPLPGLT
ncbi:DUF1552 domain-containing protein [Paraliomyxa miuraensis]|uniref:DUF1552 domain-containing protein n=1 Tax=Paraliomyxa miuraensis TaxID=376150 RepID=UPI00224EE0B7|nr:DUF1552 domain-containing protein [Paraliomyxa miuraensis]MCX4240225.1 DUF1552 domain-containing protein [Paraliomyxa miuraensis]